MKRIQKNNLDFKKKKETHEVVTQYLSADAILSRDNSTDLKHTNNRTPVHTDSNEGAPAVSVLSHDVQGRLPAAPRARVSCVQLTTSTPKSGIEREDEMMAL